MKSRYNYNYTLERKLNHLKKLDYDYNYNNNFNYYLFLVNFGNIHLYLLKMLQHKAAFIFKLIIFMQIN